MSRLKRPTRAALWTSIALSTLTLPLAVLAVSSAPAFAQGVSVSVEFRTALEPYGSWHRIARWGSVWVPAHVAHDWRPYTVGHWVYSNDYGWYWDSDESEASWGLVVYHYGRWIDDPDLGWCWIPGKQWGPSWVSWRRGHHYAGWAPLPPDQVITEYRDKPNYWVFVRTRDLIAPRLATVILPPRERDVYIRDTVVVNRTVVLSDRSFAVDPGIEPTYVAAAYGRPLPAYHVRPYVLAGTTTIQGAVALRPHQLRDRSRIRQISTEAVARQSTTTIEPARNVPPPQALGANEHGRLGDHPPRAAQNVGGPGAPQGLGAATTGSGTTSHLEMQKGRQPGAPESANGPANAGVPPHSPTTGWGGPQHPNKLNEQPLSKQHGRLGGREPIHGPGASPQTSGQGPAERNRKSEPRGVHDGAFPGHAQQTSGAGANSPEPRHGFRGIGPRRERGGALKNHRPQTSGAGSRSPEPLNRDHGHTARGERGALQKQMPHTTGAGPGPVEPRGGLESHPGGQNLQGPARGARGPGGPHEIPHAATNGAGLHGGPATLGAGPRSGAMHGAPHPTRATGGPHHGPGGSGGGERGPHGGGER